MPPPARAPRALLVDAARNAAIGTVMTRQRLDDFQLNTLADALEQTPGIQVGRRGNLTEFRARGSLVNLKVDGARQMSDGWGVTTYSLYSQDDMAELDRIEVLKGSSGANCRARSTSPRRGRYGTAPIQAYNAAGRVTPLMPRLDRSTSPRRGPATRWKRSTSSPAWSTASATAARGPRGPAAHRHQEARAYRAAQPPRHGQPTRLGRWCRLGDAVRRHRRPRKAGVHRHAS
jgi:hypothetical protein